jgi:hypothetical protein
MTRDLYNQMGDELRALFIHLDEKTIRRKMDRILDAAIQIGGPIMEEARKLMTQIEIFLRHPDNQQLKELVKTQALKLELETREL